VVHRKFGVAESVEWPRPRGQQTNEGVLGETAGERAEAEEGRVVTMSREVKGDSRE